MARKTALFQQHDADLVPYGSYGGPYAIIVAMEKKDEHKNRLGWIL